MAIANSYFNSSPITDSDIFVGTKYTTNRTVNYTAQSIADYLNVNARISISGQLTFKFTILPNVAKTIAFENGGGDGRLFSSIDKLIVSILDAGGSNITVFLDYLIDSEILLAEQNQPNSFGHYKITSYTVTANPNFYELNLEYIGGNGNIYKDVYYDMTSWASSGGIDTIPTLQQVLEEGGNSALDEQIVLRNGSVISPSSQSIWNALGIGIETGNKQSYLPAGELILVDTGGGGTIQLNATDKTLRIQDATIRTDLLNGTDRTYQLPDADGTIALTGDITTPTLQQVVEQDNLLIDAGIVFSSVSNPNLINQIGLYGLTFIENDGVNEEVTNFSSTGMQRSIYSDITLLDFETPTNPNNVVLVPNASGTLALTSDITTPTLQQVTDAGNETTNAIKVKDSESKTGIFYRGISFEDLDDGGTTVLAFENTSTPDQQIDIRGLGGTMALLSDIPTTTSQLTNDGADGVNPFITAADIPATGIQHATASGTDTYTATIAGVTSYSDADAYLIRFTNGNTTGATLNINSLGARPLYRNNDGPLLGGDVGAGGEMLCVYNSTTNVFQCIGTAPNSLFAYITNDDSVTITKGMPVYAFGGTGDRMTVKRANNSSDATSAQTVGLVLSTSIAPNQKGFILMQGLLDGLSILPTATWSDGDAVYLGATAGTITNVKPYAPNHLVYLGTVTTASNGSAGRLYVRVQNGFELQELHNVDLISNAPINNQLLTYESATSLWKNKNLTDILETFNRTQGIYYFEEFMGNLGTVIANSVNSITNSVGNGQGTLRTTSTITNRTNQQGVVEALTSANATGQAGYYYASGVYKGAGAISVETYINFTNLSVLGERFVSLFGFYTGANFTNPPNCIMIVYDEGGAVIPNAGGTPNFRCVTRGGSTVTNTITSVPVVAGQWFRLRINISNDGNTVTFFINNALVATHTTNIPLNATFLPLGSMLQKTSGVAARAMQTDYFMYEEIFTTAR